MLDRIGNLLDSLGDLMDRFLYYSRLYIKLQIFGDNKWDFNEMTNRSFLPSKNV